MLSSVKTYFIMLLCKGVLDINSEIWRGKQKKNEHAEIYLSILTVFLFAVFFLPFALTPDLLK